MVSAELRAADPPKRPIEDIAFEIIETGFQVMSCCSMSPNIWAVGHWLSDELLEFPALQDGPDANRKQLTRSVLFNVRTREARILLPEGGGQCWNPEQQIASIKRHVTDEHPRLMRLDTEGHLSELAEPSNLDEFFCWPKDLEDRLSGIPGFKGGGYICEIRMATFPLAPPANRTICSAPIRRCGCVPVGRL